MCDAVMCVFCSTTNTTKKQKKTSTFASFYFFFSSPSSSWRVWAKLCRFIVSRWFPVTFLSFALYYYGCHFVCVGISFAKKSKALLHSKKVVINFFKYFRFFFYYYYYCCLLPFMITVHIYRVFTIIVSSLC